MSVTLYLQRVLQTRLFRQCHILYVYNGLVKC